MGINIEKVRRDKMYSSLYDKYGEDFIVDAGYFDDNVNGSIDYNLHIKCTPLERVKKGVLTTENPAVLMICGAFNPIHDGHIASLKKAKQIVEDRTNDKILATYISPSHQHYINAKKGDDAIDIEERISIIGQYSDIDVCPWEGMFLPADVNFTEVYQRLEKYLELHVGKKVKVYFVCGGDNANFALSFIEYGYGVVMGRDLCYYDKMFRTHRKFNELSGDQNRFFFDYDFKNPLSSTEILKNYKHSNKTIKPKTAIRYYEDKRARAILSLLDEYLDTTIVGNCEYKKRKSVEENQKVISLDKFTDGDFNLCISRDFDSFGIRKFGYRTEIGCEIPTIEPKENITLYDDDICSGGTVGFATTLLEFKNKLTKVICVESNTSLDKGFHEILDLYDFMLGVDGGGLVINGVRNPYIFPFVSLYNRASIRNSWEFSKKLWIINKEYFLSGFDFITGLSEEHQKLFYDMGYSRDSKVSDVCQDMINLIEKLQENN